MVGRGGADHAPPAAADAEHHRAAAAAAEHAGRHPRVGEHAGQRRVVRDDVAVDRYEAAVALPLPSASSASTPRSPGTSGEASTSPPARARRAHPAPRPGGSPPWCAGRRAPPTAGEPAEHRATVPGEQRGGPAVARGGGGEQHGGGIEVPPRAAGGAVEPADGTTALVSTNRWSKPSEPSVLRSEEAGCGMKREQLPPHKTATFVMRRWSDIRVSEQGRVHESQVVGRGIAGRGPRAVPSLAQPRGHADDDDPPPAPVAEHRWPSGCRRRSWPRSHPTTDGSRSPSSGIRRRGCSRPGSRSCSCASRGPSSSSWTRSGSRVRPPAVTTS